jgi:heat shock protein HslJ
MSRLVKAAALAVACGVLVSVTACGGSETEQDPAALQGEWSLAESSVAAVDVSLAGITASFDGSRISGFSGVNQYTGTYTADADGSFSAGPLAATLMAGPEALMDVEAAYLGMLETVETFAVDGERLTLTTEEGETLVFDVARTLELAGSSWSVTGFNNGKEAVVSVALDAELTLEFGEDGTVSGTAGVNTFSGTYDYGDGTISLGPLAATMMAGPDDLMEQEALYLAALEASASWEVVNGVLYLRDAEDALQVSAVAP